MKKWLHAFFDLARIDEWADYYQRFERRTREIVEQSERKTKERADSADRELVNLQKRIAALEAWRISMKKKVEHLENVLASMEERK